MHCSRVGLLKWAAKTEPETNGAAKTDAPQQSKAILIAFMACFREIPLAIASVLTHTRLSLLQLLAASPIQQFNAVKSLS